MATVYSVMMVLGFLYYSLRFMIFFVEKFAIQCWLKLMFLPRVFFFAWWSPTVVIFLGLGANLLVPKRSTLHIG